MADPLSLAELREPKRKHAAKNPQPCSIEGCTRVMKARGWCGTHWARWRAHGDPVWEPPPLDERFWDTVDKNGPNGCWLWTGSVAANGYGQVGVDYKNVGAHRVAYELVVGPIPDGLHLDHLCRNTVCVNPSHLEPVTCRENVRRGIRARAAANVG